MVCFCQLPKPGNAISRFLLPKRSFINFVPISETGTKRGPRLARGCTETPTKSWPSPAFFPPSLLSLHWCAIQCHLRSSTGGRGWAIAPQARGQTAPALRDQDDRIQENRIRFELRLSAAEGPQASARASVRPQRDDETFLRLKSGSDFKGTVYSLPRAEILKSKPNKETRSTTGKEGFRVHPPSGQGLQRTAPHFHRSRSGPNQSREGGRSQRKPPVTPKSFSSLRAKDVLA